MKHAWIAVALFAAGPLLAQDIYGGPAVLSRGPMGRLAESSDLLVLRPSLQLMGIYEGGLSLPSVDSKGRQVGGGGSFGAAAIAGLNGYHRWRHTTAGFDYRGNFRHYTRNSYLDGIDQRLSLNIQHQATARTTFSVTGTGGTYSRAYGFGGAGSYALNYGDYSQGLDPTLSAVPAYDLLDTRTYFAAAGGDVIHQKSARLSVHVGATAFAVRRRVSGLAGLNGYSARGDVMYRLGRNSTFGVDYNFSNYRYVRGFGDSEIHVAAANYSVRLGRNWTLALRGGAYRLENLRSVRIQLDPAVAAILGQATGIEAFHGVNYGTIYGASLARNFRRAGLIFRYDRAIMPGNGILLTSRNDTLDAAYSYRGWRRWSVAVHGGASRLVTTFQEYGAYQYYLVGANTSYRIARYLHLVGHAAGRRQKLQHAAGVRNSYYVSLGLGFAPGDLPLSFR